MAVKSSSADTTTAAVKKKISLVKSTDGKIGSGGVGEKGGLKKKKRPAPTNFKFFIHKVQKLVASEMSLSSAAMVIMDNFITDFFERLAVEAGALAKRKKVVTLSSRDLQAAVRLLIPGELAKHADSEGTKAVAKFMASSK